MPQCSSDIGGNPYPSILLVGDSGTHKTRFIGDVPGMYCFDFDAGQAINRDRVVRFDTFKDTPYGQQRSANPERGIYPYGTAWPRFIKRLNEVGALLDNPETATFDKLGFKSKDRIMAIGFDSLTTLSNICMNYVLKEDGHAGQQPKIQHWGNQIALMETVMDQLTAWPIIKVVTAHIQRNTNQVTEVVEMLPLVTGKLAGRVGIYFDEVWFTHVQGRGKDKKFSLQTESYGMVKSAKTRYDVPDGSPTTWKAVAPYIMGSTVAA